MGLLDNKTFVGGLRRLAAGARRGSAGGTALGLALAILGFARSRRGPQRELLYARNLREGDTLRIRFAPDGTGVSLVEEEEPRERGGGQRIR